MLVSWVHTMSDYQRQTAIKGRGGAAASDSDAVLPTTEGTQEGTRGWLHLRPGILDTQHNNLSKRCCTIAIATLKVLQRRLFHATSTTGGLIFT